MTLEIEAASAGEIAVYAPYYAVGRRPLLPQAVGLYKRRNLEGNRQVERENAIPFVATWPISSLPSDLTLCQIQFDRDAELTYEISMPNYEFVDHLIDVAGLVNRGQQPDFSTAFYKKLMKRED